MDARLLREGFAERRLLAQEQRAPAQDAGRLGEVNLVAGNGVAEVTNWSRATGSWVWAAEAAGAAGAAARRTGAAPARASEAQARNEGREEIGKRDIDVRS